ncbi:MAG TPA: PfkB family carbohydrate kinase [Armatimonadota bacterium]|nr:PfkB family carbohydrate kinase [Armatimonadota bacterium]
MFERGKANQQVLIVGSVGLDTIETPFGVVNDVLGGAASYSSTAASFFSEVRMVGVVGDDFPDEHLKFFRSRNIDITGLQATPGATFRWNGYYEYDMNQAHTLATHLNVFETFQPNIPEVYRDTPYVFLANIDPELQLAILDQVHQPKFVLADTMNFWISGKRDSVIEVIKRVDAVTLNDAEARQLCETTSLVAAGRQLLSMGPRVVIIKKGEHGALMFTDSDYFVAPSFPLEEVHDPTGAGDTFAGGMIGYLAMSDDTSEENLRKAVFYGSVLASYTVEEFSLNRLARLESGEIIMRFSEMRHITAVAE